MSPQPQYDYQRSARVPGGDIIMRYSNTPDRAAIALRMGGSGLSLSANSRDSATLIYLQLVQSAKEYGLSQVASTLEARFITAGEPSP